MTLEEIVKEIPFDIKGTNFAGKEEFFAAIKKHLSIIAVKAEIIGNKELTAALDTLRELIPKIETLTDDEKKAFEKASKVTNEYITAYGAEGQEEQDILAGDIYYICKEHDELLKRADELHKQACELETKFRNLYGKPSGAIKESSYRGDDDEL